MKIVTWNCCGKFREDYEAIFKEDADIYVIQECENPDADYAKYKQYKEVVDEYNYKWVGDIHYKGLGIFAKKDINLEEIEVSDGGFKHFLPLRVNDSFNLLGVWAMGEDKDERLNPYVEMIHDYFNANESLFDKNLVMCGDLNSSVVFDGHHKAKDDEGNPKDHTHLNEKLNEKGLFSAYHDLYKEEQGKETKHTFYQARHLNDYYHLDHVYAKKGVVKKLKILDHRTWINLSDHLPVVFEIDESKFD